MIARFALFFFLVLGACSSAPPPSLGERDALPRDDGPRASDAATAPDAIAASDAAQPAPDATAASDASVADAAPIADARAPDASAFVGAPINVPAGPLCDIPPGWVDAGGDPRDPPCQIEHDHFTDRDPEQPKAALKVVSWNVRFGIDSATVLDTLRTHPTLIDADVVLLQEVGRNDLESVPPAIHQARDLAQALAMNYLFAVEWDRREDPSGLGEHGVAILSKYPLGNVAPIRHVQVHDWWQDNRHYGGRITLGADLYVAGRVLRVYSSHLDTRPLIPNDDGRAAQAAEIRTDADRPDRAAIQIVGGDLNTWTCNPRLYDCTVPPRAEQAVQDFLAAGWLDGTAGFNGITQRGEGFFPQRLDWIFHRRSTATTGGSLEDARGSDHFPIWFMVVL